jgi:hypothetical protein
MGELMDTSLDLHILWTNADPITAEKIVFMWSEGLTQILKSGASC